MSGQIRYGVWRGVDSMDKQQLERNHGDTAESVVVLPISATHLEIHCHGGVAATTRIINDLRAFGAKELCEGEPWDLEQPLLIREAQDVLSRCMTTETAAIALDQVRGSLLNWADEALKKASRKKDVVDVQQEAAEMVGLAKWSSRIDCRFDVVVLGAPNVGKSSLINAMVGYDRSITMDLAGTTRDVLHADTAMCGVPIRLSDTAGIRESSQPIESAGVAKAQDFAAKADLVLLIRDPDTDFASVPAHWPVIRVLNKADLLSADADSKTSDATETIAITGHGINTLLEQIASKLVAFPPTGSPLSLTERQTKVLRGITEANSNRQIQDLLIELINGSSTPLEKPDE